MKTLYSKHHNSSGSALFVALITLGIIGFLLASYLTLLSYENRGVVRSQAWNAAIPMTEAGIEEALAHLNMNGVTNNLLIPRSGIPSLYSDGWTAENGAAVMRRSVGNGSYVVCIYTNGQRMPVIESTGYVPLSLAGISPSGTFLAAVGVTQTQNQLRRTVRVTTTNSAIFLKGITVKQGIDSHGNSTLADAFDSSDPLFSTLGKYVAAKATDGGGIASLSTNANVLSFGSIHVYGTVAVTPTGGISSNSWYIGSHVWQTANPSTHIQPGYFTKDFNVTLPNVQTPTWTSTGPPSGTVSNISYNYVLGSGNYQTTSGTVSGKVYVTGDAVWYITSSAAVNFATTDSIILGPNASLVMYVGSPSVNLPNVVNNTTSDRFIYFGLPTNTSLTQRVNADFIGSVYAPNALYTLGGNGSGSEQKFIGAIVAKSMDFNDFFTFHYDKVLATMGLSRGYIVRTWNEIDPTTAKVSH
jgi:hypothetical protein